MAALESIDLTQVVLDVSRNLKVSARRQPAGPPHRIDGLTIGIANLQPGQSPHNGEMHPDGDEILFVVAGTLVVTGDSSDTPLTLAAGEACIVRQGEWHLVDCTEPSTVMYITPGPGGEARFA